MKQPYLKSILAIILLGSASLFAENKILTVDLEKVFANYTKAQESEKQFLKTAEAAQKELTTMGEEFMKLNETYAETETKFKNPSISEDARKNFQTELKDLEKNLEKKQAEIEEYRTTTSEKLNQRREAIAKLHGSEIKEKAELIAKQKGADLVLNKTDLVILYAKDSLSITDEFIKMLNNESPKTSPAESKTAKTTAIQPEKKNIKPTKTAK